MNNKFSRAELILWKSHHCVIFVFRTISVITSFSSSQTFIRFTHGPSVAPSFKNGRKWKWFIFIKQSFLLHNEVYVITFQKNYIITNYVLKSSIRRTFNFNLFSTFFFFAFLSAFLNRLRLVSLSFQRRTDHMRKQGRNQHKLQKL